MNHNLTSLKNTFSCLLSFVILFLGTACTNHETAINSDEIIQLLQGFGRDWHQLQWKEEQLVLVQPYEGVNAQFTIFEDFKNEQWIIESKKGFSHTIWLISSVEKKENQYIFKLINQDKPSQKTTLSYDAYSLQRKIGQWAEIENNFFFEDKVNFFTQKSSIWLFEEIFSTPSDENLVIETENIESIEETDSLKDTPEEIIPIQEEDKAQWFRFTGGVGQAYYPITAFFCINEQNKKLRFVKGRYYYDKVWVDLKLTPLKESQNTWKLQEFSSLTPKQTTGYFLGEVDENHRFSGYWHSADGQKTLAFDMTEKELPYILEDYQEKNTTNSISFPQFPNASDNPAIRRFNNDVIKAKIRNWKRSFPQFDKIEYELLSANQNLINLVLSIKKQNEILAVFCLNFDLEEAKEVKLRHIFEINDDFRKELYTLINRAIRFQNQKNATNIAAISEDLELENYNFIEKNIRILLFDKKSSNYIPIYISYKKLESYLQETTLERYQITKE